MSRALVVDDEPNIRFLVRSILYTLGYEVIEAENGRVAIDLIARSDNFDVVITDVRMPHLSGIELTERLKQQSPSLPVIVISAFANEGYEALDRGADRFVPKPFSHNTLVNALRGLSPPAPGRQQ